jgi:hypothetical protein
MATSPTLATNDATATTGSTEAPELLIWLAAQPNDAASLTASAMEVAFAGRSIVVVCPDPPPTPLPPGMRWTAPHNTAPRAGWVLTAHDYGEAAQAAREHQAPYVLLLGAHDHWATPETLRALSSIVEERPADLAIPRPPASEEQGLVNAALLYPLTRALFAADVHYPLPTDAFISIRLLERLESAAQRVASAANDAVLWPVSEAAVAGCQVRELILEGYTLPRPPESAFNELFTSVASSLFADIEAKASYWQRARIFAPGTAAPWQPPTTSAAEVSAEVLGLVDNFRLAYTSLQDIWSLILPPQTLLALKRLSLAPAESFALSPQVWARIVYDFALAYRLRTINRGHLLGALTPLYMAWVTSHARASEADAAAGTRMTIETAQAFELERAYVVSRWRWPDRFNP